MFKQNFTDLAPSRFFVDAWDMSTIRQRLPADRLMADHQIVQNPLPALKVLKGGGAVITPTDTLYGLAVRALDDAALERLFRLKGRSLERQVPVFVENPQDMLQSLVADVSPLAQKLIAEFWPGPLTLVMPAKPGLSRYITGNTQAVGVRQSAHPVIRAMIQALGEPLTGTSANLTDAPSPYSLDQIAPSLLQAVDLVIDGGLLTGRKGSTVLDLTGAEVKILRQGDLPLERILSVTQS